MTSNMEESFEDSNSIVKDVERKFLLMHAT